MSPDASHVCAKQAIELTWWTIKQLLAADKGSVVLAALRLIQSSKVNMAIVEACRRLPLCSFATPKTWSGMHLHLRRPSQRSVNIVVRCTLLQARICITGQAVE